MAFVTSRNVQELLIRARAKMGYTQREMADAVGSSLRTVARWEAGTSSPDVSHFHRLAALLFPRDAALARDAAAAGGTTLEQLGVVAAALSTAPPGPWPAASAALPDAPHAPPPLPVRWLVDAVVCSVAAALEAAVGAPVSLAHARAATAAALTSARNLRLDLDAAVDAVAPPPSAKEAEASPSGKTGPAKPKRA